VKMTLPSRARYRRNQPERRGARHDEDGVPVLGMCGMAIQSINCINDLD
jgi:hypothetical protein